MKFAWLPFDMNFIWRARQLMSDTLIDLKQNGCSPSALPKMKGGEKDMKKLAYVFVFVSLMVAVVFWATSELDYLTCTACLNPYLLGT